EMKQLKARATPPGTEVILDVRGLEALSDRGSPALRGIDFEIRSGEILGIAGVGGNGQSELAQCLLGLRKVAAGTIRIGGIDISRDDPKRTRARGVAYVPEDRRVEGLVLAFTVADDFILGKQDRAPYATNGVLDPAAILKAGGRLAVEYDVRPPNPRAIVANLSGGNQQKVVLGRELSERPKLIVVSQPTRGLDIAATEYVHERLLEQRGQGAAILLVSSELDEIRALSDRIAVMFEGRIVAVLDAASATEERLGLLMAGHTEAAAWLARGRELLNVRFRDHLVTLDGGDLHDARSPRSELCRVILGRMKSGFALEERHAESFAGCAIDEPVPALEPLEPLRRGSDRLFDQLGPGFELAWRSLVLRDTSEHRVPPLCVR